MPYSGINFLMLWAEVAGKVVTLPSPSQARNMIGRQQRSGMSVQQNLLLARLRMASIIAGSSRIKTVRQRSGLVRADTLFLSSL